MALAINYINGRTFKCHRGLLIYMPYRDFYIVYMVRFHGDRPNRQRSQTYLAVSQNGCIVAIEAPEIIEYAELKQFYDFAPSTR